jgi:hypothetical protein
MAKLTVKTEQILTEISMGSVKKISFNWHGSAISPSAKPAIVNRFIRDWFKPSQKNTIDPDYDFYPDLGHSRARSSDHSDRLLIGRDSRPATDGSSR